jgi:hypothetical protein
MPSVSLYGNPAAEVKFETKNRSRNSVLMLMIILWLTQASKLFKVEILPILIFPTMPMFVSLGRILLVKVC